MHNCTDILSCTVAPINLYAPLYRYTFVHRCINASLCTVGIFSALLLCWRTCMHRCTDAFVCTVVSVYSYAPMYRYTFMHLWIPKRFYTVALINFDALLFSWICMHRRTDATCLHHCADTILSRHCFIDALLCTVVPIHSHALLYRYTHMDYALLYQTTSTQLPAPLYQCPLMHHGR